MTTRSQTTRSQTARASAAPASSITGRVAALDWPAIAAALDVHGCATTGALLDAEECSSLAAVYADDAQFRSRVVMARHGFGRGEYKYFTYPLPPLVAELRTALYAPLAAVANGWNAALGTSTRFPDDHAGYIVRCHKAGQTKPTPLLLQYGPGDYNCLHQDLYGEHVFPLQVTVLLSRPGRDFAGGEFVLTEQRPRMQSRAEVVPLGQGEAVIFPVHHRPVRGTRGTYRVNMRHGVSRVRSGHRSTLGIIFHEAK
ncbi:MAG: 2OG-Fe(II) oxygenase [Xanthobacteraceae bacterium]